MLRVPRISKGSVNLLYKLQMYDTDGSGDIDEPELIAGLTSAGDITICFLKLFPNIC